MVGYLETIGRRRDQVLYSGASAYMYDLSASSEIVKKEYEDRSSITYLSALRFFERIVIVMSSISRGKTYPGAGASTR